MTDRIDTLKLALRALNTAPRFRVGDTDSYKIASCSKPPNWWSHAGNATI
jgi:hypothetical protein